MFSACIYAGEQLNSLFWFCFVPLLCTQKLKGVFYPLDRICHRCVLPCLVPSRWRTNGAVLCMCTPRHPLEAAGLCLEIQASPTPIHHKCLRLEYPLKGVLQEDGPCPYAILGQRAANKEWLWWTLSTRGSQKGPL